MIKYARILDNETGRCEVAEGTNIEKYIEMGMTQLDVEQSDVDNNWYLASLCPHKSEAEKEKERQEAISHLKCTKRVFALMLQQLGISYSQLKELIATNEQAQLEWDLCVELERSNPLLDIMGAELGITSKQLDDMFKYANGWIGTLQ